MQQERDQLSPDEYVLRLVPKKPSHYDPSDPQRILTGAFSPSPKRDSDGLSVYRERYATPAEAAKSDGNNEAGYVVVRIKVEDLTQYGMTAVADPQEGRPGHALIPELGAKAKKANKKVFRERREHIVRLANSEHAIVIE